MINVKEACNIALENIPDGARIIGYTELSDKYIFNVVPRIWNGDLSDYPCGGYVNYVTKLDGKFYCVCCDEIDDQVLQEVKTFKIDEIDISEYLSEEDAKFMKEIKAKERKDS